MSVRLTREIKKRRTTKKKTPPKTKSEPSSSTGGTRTVDTIVVGLPWGAVGCVYLTCVAPDKSTITGVNSPPLAVK